MPAGTISLVSLLRIFSPAYLKLTTLQLERLQFHRHMLQT